MTSGSDAAWGIAVPRPLDSTCSSQAAWGLDRAAIQAGRQRWIWLSALEGSRPEVLRDGPLQGAAGQGEIDVGADLGGAACKIPDLQEADREAVFPGAHLRKT